MKYLPGVHPALVLSLLGICLFTKADMNVTVDDFDRSILYLPSADKWQHTAASDTTDRYLGSTSFTTTPNAYAMFNFSGATAIYFMGYGAIPTNTSGLEVQLDGQTFILSDNADPSGARGQQILFSKTGLDPTIPHGITVRKLSPDPTRFEVDAFIYSTPGSAQGGPQLTTGALAGAIIGGLLVGSSAVLALLWWMRRRRRKAKEQQPPEVKPVQETKPAHIEPYPLPVPVINIGRHASTHKPPLPSLAPSSPPRGRPSASSSSSPLVSQGPSPSTRTSGESGLTPSRPSRTSRTSVSPARSAPGHFGNGSSSGPTHLSPTEPEATKSRRRAGSASQAVGSSSQPTTSPPSRRNVRFVSGVPSQSGPLSPIPPPYPGSPT